MPFQGSWEGQGLSSSPRSPRGQQDSRATADHHAQRRARSRELRQVRICPLSHIDAIERPRDPLLPLSRLRRVAAALRFGLQQSPGASAIFSTRSCGPGNRATARRSPPYPERNRPTARSRARGGIRPNAVKTPSDAISPAFVKASTDCSPPIRKVFSRWTNCANACPNLRRREQADNAELQAIVDQSADRAAYLRLA